MSQTYEDNIGRVLAALTTAVHRDHRRRRRRQIVAAIAIAFAIGGTAIAATDDWWRNSPPATDQAVVDIELQYRDLEGRLRQLADPAKARTVATAPGIILHAAPTPKGGYCLLPQRPRAEGDSAVAASLGVSCGFAPGADRGRPASTFGTIATDAGGLARFYAYGRITQPQAHSVDLSAAAGMPLRIALEEHGFFLAALPRSTWTELNDTYARITVRDRKGNTLREACVLFGPSPDSRSEPTENVLGRLAATGC